MKKLICLILLMAIPSICFADVFIVIDSQTKVVESCYESFSNITADDIVLAQGHELIILPGTVELYNLDRPVTDYQYDPDTKVFFKDFDKANKRNKKMKEKKEKEDELELIEKQMRKIAVEQLKAEGLSFKHY